jgi:hypothetical protein
MCGAGRVASRRVGVGIGEDWGTEEDEEAVGTVVPVEKVSPPYKPPARLDMVRNKGRGMVFGSYLYI